MDATLPNRPFPPTFYTRVVSETNPADLSGTPLAAVPNSTVRGAVTGMLLRFISCGILCLGAGFAWWQHTSSTSAHVDVGSTMGDMLILLSGFIVGGLLWYIRDVRLHRRAPERINDERIVFSFVVFVLMPLAVLALVGIIWLVAAIFGA
jgi:nitrate reductase NapE component